MRLRKPNLHQITDKLTEILIFFMVIFSPWAFGTTESWSIWIINITSYILGVLLITKWTIKYSTKYNSWTKQREIALNPKEKRQEFYNRLCSIFLTVGMLLLLLYILTSAINARASFDPNNNEYSYLTKFNSNLPHSFDAKATWFTFWQYLGLMILFWAIRDWLSSSTYCRKSISINPRLKKLLFLMILSATVLAIESAFQRIYYGTQQGNLLFLLEPNINSKNVSQFGSFAYRSNACSYFNLIWPISIGLFIQLSHENLLLRKHRIGKGPEIILIPCTILIAASPIISSSRGGSLVMITIFIIVSISILLINIRTKYTRISILLTLMSGIICAYYLGWNTLEPRLNNLFNDNMSGRNEIYKSTLQMIESYGFFGSGPGTFETVVQFELGNNLTYWPSWAHSDYLEFTLTFGKAGIIIIIFIAITLLIKIIFCRGQSFTLFGIISLLSVIIHATLDFPLQVLSILVTVCVLSAILTHNDNRLIRSKKIN